MLLLQHPALIGVQLAQALKDQCYAAWSDDPGRAVDAAAALNTLAEMVSHPEVQALAVWTAGIAALAEGRLEQAVSALDAASARYETLGEGQTAASVQIGKLMALGLLGRYDEAIACGLTTRDTLLAHGDLAAAGRIELNLGNIADRCDRYAEAVTYYRSAHARFLTLDEPGILANIEIGLADVLTQQNQFAVAHELYVQALYRAEHAGLAVTQALAERHLGDLALAQGRYDEALSYLERSRRRYAGLGLPHESAYAELKLAEAYLELNLAPEAAAIFARVIPQFAELGMRSEHAWALACHGQTTLLLGDAAGARLRLAEARQLFAAEGNAVTAAVVAVFEAQLLYHERQHGSAAIAAADAEAVFQTAGNHGQRLLAAWLRGEALRAAGKLKDAHIQLTTVLHDAETAHAVQIVQRCAASLGLLAVAQGDVAAAKPHFTRSIAIIEQMRAPLPAEEFRTAFLSDKLSPFTEMVRLCLEAGRVPEALGYVERARSRALVEMLGSASESLRRPRDDFEAELFGRLATLRQELNWCYQRISHMLAGDRCEAPALQNLHALAKEHEAAIGELTRQIQQHGGDQVVHASSSLAELQGALDAETGIVEYYSLDEELLAFVVTSEEVRVVRGLASEPQVADLVERLRFQTDAMRREVGRNADHLSVLLARTRHYLGKLYDALLRPLAGLIGERRLAIVPHRALHYVPFRALFDGAQYVIEQREVCTVPSAAVLHHCLQQPPTSNQRAVFVGVPDARAPRVRDEVTAIAPLWPDQVTLLDGAATLTAVQHHAPEASVLHLACHGQFRADNPLFSSLHLADGWLTARDAYGLKLDCNLVVLSACETGVSAVAPGDELIGLARGFFAAGAPSLVVSLWMVDDATTTRLMTTFYTRLRAGDRPGAALRAAQCALMQHHPHPFFWAPFVLMGRW